MEDSGIVALYLARSENAIEETSVKYGKYCCAIAYNLLSNKQDADESVNDACLGAWNSIPPHRPAVLSSFLGKIVRRVSINRWKERGRKKRGGFAAECACERAARQDKNRLLFALRGNGRKGQPRPRLL